MLDTYLPAVLPPAMAVADGNPSAAEAITAFNRFSATLPPRPSTEQLNEQDVLRTQALTELGSEFFATLEDEETALLGTLRGDIDALTARWNRLEAIQALRAWRAQPQKYTIKHTPALTIGTGNGYARTVYAREMLQALAECVEKGA